MDHYSTKRKVMASMALILMLAVGSALGYLVGSAHSDASSAGALPGAGVTFADQMGDVGPCSLTRA